MADDTRPNPPAPFKGRQGVARHARAGSILGLVGLLALSACDPAKKDWEAARRADTVAAYDAFLHLHGTSSQAAQARDRIAALELDLAQAAGTPEALEAFLQRHAQGARADAARQALEDLRFGHASADGSLRALEAYLAAYPAPRFAVPARARISALLAERDPAFSDVRSVHVEVRETYGEAEGVALPFAETATALLRHAGIEAAADAASADATLSVRSDGEAYSASYLGQGELYTGCSLAGSITLETPAGGRVRQGFADEVSTPMIVTYTLASPPDEPDDAPFAEAFDSGFPPAAAQALGRAFGPVGLLAALGDESERVQRGAARALGAMGEAVQPRLVGILQGEDATARRGAAAALGASGARRAIPPLVQALDGPAVGDPSLRDAVAEALAEIGPAAVEPLVAALARPNPQARLGAILALGELGEERAVGPLAERLTDADPDVRCAAAQALGRHPFPRALAALAGVLEASSEAALRGCAMTALLEEEEEERETVADLLYEHDDPRLVSALVGALDVPSGEPAGLRDQAADALGRIQSPAVPALLRALEHPSLAVREGAAMALVQSADARAVKPLVRALNAGLADPSSSLARDAAQALGTTMDERAVAPLLTALDIQDTDIRCAAAHALVQIGAERAEPRLRALAQAGGPSCVKDALMNLTGEGFEELEEMDEEEPEG